MCFVLFTEFNLKNKVAGTCADVAGNPGVDPGTNVHTWSCEPRHPDSDQIWSMDGAGRLMSKPSAPGMCLAVSGTDVQIDTCDNGPDQVWEFLYDMTGDYFLIRHVDTGLCVNLATPNDPSNSVNLILAACDDTAGSDDWWEQLGVPLGE